MGLCQSNPISSLLSSDLLTSQINQFFMGMAIKQLGVGSILDKVKSSLFSGGLGNLGGLKNLLGDNLANSTFANTSKDFVSTAMDEANKLGDPTLPAKSLLLMADSNKSSFKEAFKALNVAQHASSSLGGVKGLVSGLKNGTSGGSGNFVSGLSRNLAGIANLPRDFSNPNMVPSKDLKNLSSYYTNMMTLMPIEALAKHNEGDGKPAEYVNKALNHAFSKDAQNNFVENTLFSKFKGQDTINVDDFFESNYSTLKDDNGIRKGLCDSFIKTLTPTVLRSIIGNKAAGGFC